MTLPTAEDKRTMALRARERAEKLAVQCVSEAIDRAAQRGQMAVTFVPAAIPQDFSAVRWKVVFDSFQTAGFHVDPLDTPGYFISWDKSE